MRNKLLIVFTLIYSNSMYAVKSQDNMNLYNWIKAYRVKRQDILNNKEIIPGIKIKDKIIEMTERLKRNPSEYREENRKLLISQLAFLGVKLDDLLVSSKVK